MRNDPADPGLRYEGVARGAQVSVELNGRAVAAYEGQSVLGLLWADGVHALHVTARRHEPRGFFCAIGVCFDCLVTIDGRRNVRACLEPVRSGMRIETQTDAGHPPLGAGHAPH